MSLPPPWLLNTRYISVRKYKRVKATTMLKGSGATTAEIPVHKA